MNALEPDAAGQGTHVDLHLQLAEASTGVEPEFDSNDGNGAELLERYMLDDITSSDAGPDARHATSIPSRVKVLIRHVAKSDHAAMGITREIAALSVIADRSIPRIVECKESLSDIWLVTESRLAATLRQYMEIHKSLSQDQLKSLVTQLFSGVAAIFNAGFAHLRICDETLFVDDAGALVIKNFEYAYEYGKERVDDLYASVEAKHGTDIYTAPEVFASIRYNARKAVMWSCGVVVYYICTGQIDRLASLAHPAFDNQDSPAPKRKMSTASQQALKVPVVTYPDRFGTPAYARDIISKMLQVEPSKRAELIEVAAKVPKEFVGKETRPLMELAWQDYKSHVGPLAGLAQDSSDNSSLFSFGGASVFSRDSFSQLLPGRRKSFATKLGAAAELSNNNSRRRSFFG